MYKLVLMHDHFYKSKYEELQNLEDILSAGGSQTVAGSGFNPQVVQNPPKNHSNINTGMRKYPVPRGGPRSVLHL